ncbi:MAG: hypothetical protein CFK52_12455 [Chloracidobacterium sp. CP2_5A]|nr:MAG: hypothetical protein CFK52_12455 [Chloracidobacterium sp. CP2_5A]
MATKMTSTPKAAILVVDDDPTVRSAVTRALQAQGYQVATAEDGRAALERISAATFEIIVCDIAMPNMDGIELCKVLRLDPRTSGIPFLFLSAYQDIEARLEGLSAGADDFLGKPFSINEMTYRINRLLTNRRLPLVDEALEVNPNHLGQVSFEQALDLIRSQSLSGLLSVILPGGSAGRVSFEEGRLTEAQLESVSGEVIAEQQAALEVILSSPRLAFVFSGQQTLDDAVLMSRITRIVESEASL